MGSGRETVPRRLPLGHAARLWRLGCTRCRTFGIEQLARTATLLPGSAMLSGLLPAQAHCRPPRLAGSGWRDPPVGMLGIGTPTCFGAIAARPAAAVALAVAEINERVRGGEKGGGCPHS